MKSLKLYLILSIIVNLLLFSCSNNEDEDDSNIRGIVIDENGTYIKNAKIEVVYDLESTNERSPKSVRFGFESVKKQYVKFWITKYNTNDTVRVLMNRVCEAGYYMVTWDGNNSMEKIVVNNIYDYHIQREESTETGQFFYFIDDYGDVEIPVDYDCFAKTNIFGRFTFDQREIVFGFPFELVDEMGNPQGMMEISRNITLWALHPDYLPAYSEKVYIDQENGAEVTLIMKRK